MEARELVIVLIDISGYTRFIKSNKGSMVHAEEIIFQLLESIVDGSVHPLILNKLEGDAVLMYAETGSTPNFVAQSILEQVMKAFPLFREKAKSLAFDRSMCPCDACQNIHLLRLKAIIHNGTAVIRYIRQFIEIAGEDVIIAHRLLKNSIPLNQYVLMTDAYYKLLGSSGLGSSKAHTELIEDVGQIQTHYFEVV